MVDGGEFGISKGTGYDEGYEFMVNFRVKSWGHITESLYVRVKVFLCYAMLLFVWICIMDFISS